MWIYLFCEESSQAKAVQERVNTARETRWTWVCPGGTDTCNVFHSWRPRVFKGQCQHGDLCYFGLIQRRGQDPLLSSQHPFQEDEEKEENLGKKSVITIRSPILQWLQMIVSAFWHAGSLLERVEAYHFFKTLKLHLLYLQDLSLLKLWRTINITIELIKFLPYFFKKIIKLIIYYLIVSN